MRNILFASLLILAALAVQAQGPSRVFPDIVTSQTNASIALTGYKSTIEGYLIQDGTDIHGLQQTVTDPTIGNAALDARLKALESPAQPPPPTIHTLSLIDPVNLPLGALSGIVDGLGWNSGQWQAMADGVAPIAQGSRSFVLPAGATLVSLTVKCLVDCQFKIADSTNGFSWASPAVLAGSAVTAQVTGWTKSSGPIALSMTSGAAVNVRLTGVQFQ